MADPLYQIIGPQGDVLPGAVVGPQWLQPGEKLGPQIDASGRGLGAPSLAAAPEKPADVAPPPAPTVAPPPEKSAPSIASVLVPPAEAAQSPQIDFGKFGMRPATTTPGQPAPPTAQSPPIDFRKFGLQPAAPETVPVTPAPPQFANVPNEFGAAPIPNQQQLSQGIDWASLPGKTAASAAAFINAIPRGVFGGRTIDYGNAAIGTPLRMLTGLQGPSAAFQQGLQREQDINQQLQQSSPIASTTGQVVGALTGGALASPYLGWGIGASALPRLGQAASYLARNAGMGAGMSYLDYGDPGTGALIGGAIPALHVLSSPLTTGLSWAGRQLSPLWSKAQQEISTSRQLADRLGGSPIESSPVGPLNLAQATDNPQIAAATDIAPTYAGAASDQLATRQQQAVTQQIGQIGAPATLAEASTGGTKAIRGLDDLVSQRSRELWSHPNLTDFQLPTDQSKQGMQASLNAIQRDDPGLLLGMTSQIRRAVNGLNSLPDRVNLRNLNSYLSVLKAVARHPPEDNPRAGALASRLLSDATKSLDATVRSSGAPSGFLRAYQAARDFTRRESQILGTQDMRRLLAQNGAGLFKEKPSEAMDHFFDFARGGGEGPTNLKELQDFADEIKGAWLGRGEKFLQLADLRNQLRDNVRSYVAASLAKVAHAGEGEKLTPKAAQDFLRRNMPWMRDSGLFSTIQIGAADKLLDYVEMLRRPAMLQQMTNSATWQRFANDKTFVGQILSPTLVRTAYLIGAGYGLLHGGLGGLEHGMAGGLVAEGLNNRIHTVQAVMRTMMAEALLDPAKAQALLMRASPGNRMLLSPRVRDWLDGLRLATGASVLPQYSAPGIPVPAAAPAP